ncbi:MAG: CoA transferase [Thermoanaerobaculia bacterium]|nr:CoA transferase [Thermoanaerobaculia bacterium]
MLELGSFIVPAYAGMVLAEQGHEVEKWWTGDDPVLHLNAGDQLWRWLNEPKRLVEKRVWREALEEALPAFDAVIENIRPATWKAWGIDREALALRYRVRWVSMEAELDGGRSFDAVAQAQALGGISPPIPFYIGDTAGGLWLAFKALASPEPGHFRLFQASCLAKLVEGELMVPRQAWDRTLYRLDAEGAAVEFRGEIVREPLRDTEWRRRNLRHRGGRIRI